MSNVVCNKNTSVMTKVGRKYFRNVRPLRSLILVMDMKKGEGKRSKIIQ